MASGIFRQHNMGQSITWTNIDFMVIGLLGIKSSLYTNIFIEIIFLKRRLQIAATVYNIFSLIDKASDFLLNNFRLTLVHGFVPSAWECLFCLEIGRYFIAYVTPHYGQRSSEII